MLILYQFPISHYCEKARWALDFKQLDYKTKNLLPGLHLITTKQMAAESHVPILKHDQHVIQGSDAIITYLDLAFPQRQLTPTCSEMEKQALEWELFASEEVGDTVRRCVYEILLPHPALLIPLMIGNNSRSAQWTLKACYPALTRRMRQNMQINPESARQSRRQLFEAIAKINLHLMNRSFMVGEQFSRADLSIAALLAPLFQPEQYGLNWPDQLPEQLLDLSHSLQECLPWAEKIYANYR